MKKVVLFSCLILMVSLMNPLADANKINAQAVAPAATQIELEPVVGGLSRTVYITHSRDGSNRLFILEQAGRILVLQPGASTPTVFLNISAKVLSTGNEQGLLGLAFHPAYSLNRRFFVNYTRQTDGATVIAEYQASAADANVADLTEKVILTVAQPAANHNGGMIEFGPDGYLYIAMGDGGSANDPNNRAQSIDDLLGKILRIDIDQRTLQTEYASPGDNPFFGALPGRDEIWAYGLRNPWRFSFDRLTGQLYAGDVGQGAIEEVDIIAKNGNYGWRVFEGTRCTGLGPASCMTSGFIPPIFEYTHTGGRCSVTGGYVYRGMQSTLPLGSYVYADFCSGEIFQWVNNQQELLLDTGLLISSFGEDEAGEIYVVALSGAIYRIKGTVQPPPTTEFTITQALVRKRGGGKIIQPITVRANGKKFEAVVFENSAFPIEASVGASILVNGVQLNTEYTTSDAGTPIFVGRLRRDMLAAPGILNIEVVRANGTRSNQLKLDVINE
ncbi:MAG: PQQ-dependent sugar dehydrogenase [Acidobacteriota bacterium]